MKIVEPGLAPSTSFAANSGDSSDDLMPAAYAAFAERYLGIDARVPHGLHHRGGRRRGRLRGRDRRWGPAALPAGADSVMLAELRQSLSEQAFMDRMRAMFGGAPVR